MPSLRTLAPFAVMLGLLLAAPAAGGAGHEGGPPAEAAGGGAPPLIPSIVNNRIVRVEAALARAAGYADRNQRANVIRELNSARAQARMAWNAAKYVIKTTPPTPAGDAFPDGTGGGSAYAGREDTAFAAIDLQHDVVVATLGLMTKTDAKSKALRKSWFATIASSQAVRSGAVNYVHSLKKPGPAFPGVMRGVVPLVNDELKEINGKIKLTNAKGILRKALVSSRKRALTARGRVNKYWPAVPSG